MKCSMALTLVYLLQSLLSLFLTCLILQLLDWQALKNPILQIPFLSLMISRFRPSSLAYRYEHQMQKKYGFSQ